MKTFNVVPWILVAALIISHFIRTDEPQERTEPTHEIERIQAYRDSLLEVIRIQSDTIQTALHVIESKDRDILKAAEHRKQLIQKYESIRFVSYPNDSARMSALAELYPSLRRRQGGM